MKASENASHSDKLAESAELSALSTLVRRARDGETEAQEALIQSYQKRLGGFVYSMIPDPSQIDDLCQAIFVKTILSLRQLRDPDRFESWFFKLARNACLSHLRREKFRRLFSPLSPDHHEIAAAAPSEPSADLRLLRAALQALPEKQRSLLALVQDRESNYEQLAATFGIGVGALKTRVHRAKLALKERIAYVRNDSLE